MPNKIEFIDIDSYDYWAAYVPTSESEAFLRFLRGKIDEITVDFRAIDTRKLDAQPVEDAFRFSKGLSKEKVKELISQFESNQTSPNSGLAC